MTPPKGFSEQRLEDILAGKWGGYSAHICSVQDVRDLVAEIRQQAALLTRAAILIQCHVGADPDSFSAWMEDYEKGEQA